jgi:adenylyltransferase/sulfurtransferase
VRDDQMRRYARHILLPEVGGTGQARLLAASVAVSDAKGANAALLVYLAAAGVGTLIVRDSGHVTAKDLGGAVLYEATDLGRPRLEAVRDRLLELNPDVRVVADGDASLSALPERADDPRLWLQHGAACAGRALRELLGESSS